MRYITNILLANTSSQIAAKAVNIILGFLMVGLLTRYLGVGGYGTYVLVFTYLSFFGIISDFGLQLSLVRDFSYSKNLDQQNKTAYFSLKLLLTIISTMLALAVLVFFPYEYNVKLAILVGAVAVFAGQLNAYGASVLQSELKLNIVAILEVVNRVATVLAILIFIYLKMNIFLIIGSVLFGNLVSFGIYVYLTPSYYQLGFRSVIVLMKSIMKNSFLIGITSLLALLYFKIDTLMLSVMKSESDVGIYSIAYKILENIIVIWGFYMASVYPLLSKFKLEKDFKNYNNLIIRSIFLLLISSLIVITLVNFTSNEIIFLLAGFNFVKSSVALKILIYTVPFLLVNNLFYFLFLASNKLKPIMVAICLTLALNIILNYRFIPLGSYIAASYITIVSEAFLFIMYTYFIFKHHLFKL